MPGGTPFRSCLVPADCDWPVVLGFDPGTRAVGYGAVVAAPDGPRLLAAGVLRVPAKLPLPQRLERIRVGATEVIDRTRPRVVVLERAFVAANVQSAFRIGEGRGVLLACAAGFGASVEQYAPATAKKAVMGNGAASKGQVAHMVAAILGSAVLELGHDATDALALALTHLKRMDWSSTVERGQSAGT